MALFNSIKMAFKSLVSFKLRTFLTMLGVIIGVTTVALLTTVSSGATGAIMESLGKESRLVTLLTESPTNPFTMSSLGSLVAGMQAQETTGEFVYCAVAKSDLAVDHASKLVDLSVNVGGNQMSYKMRVGSTVRAVDSNFLDVRKVEVDGKFAENDFECTVDREFIDAFLDGKSNEEVINTTVFIGGKIQSYEYTFSSSVRADIDEFYAALVGMYRLYGVTTVDETLDETKISENGGIYSLNDTIDPILYYNPESLEEQVRINLDAREYEFAGDYDIDIIEHFVGGNTYTIVGVVVENDSSFMGTSGLNSSGSTSGSSIGSGTIAALIEYSKTTQGNVYVPLVDSNVYLFGDYANLSEVPLSGAYFLFDNEDEIDASVVNMGMALMSMGYTLFDDCYIIPMNTVTQIMGMTMSILTILLTVIATISLVVGGIGIMNIMLVAVSERTREIGVRKAIGAKRSSILLQFLIEALVVSLVGGLIGLFISFVGSLIVGSVMGIALVMPLWVIAMSLGFCLAIGVIFGMYPAVKASRLQPIDALHRD